jgi:hypothetical protein
MFHHRVSKTSYYLNPTTVTMKNFSNIIMFVYLHIPKFQTIVQNAEHYAKKRQGCMTKKANS